MSAPLLDSARDFYLASLLTTYPDAEVEETLLELRETLRSHPGAAALVEALVRGGLDGARSTYLDIFDRGGRRASLYETEHGHMRGMGKGNELADIAGFYLAFGVSIDSQRVHEAVDHVAVELEFYGLLLLKEHHLDGAGDVEGVAVVRDARRKFLLDHLGRFAGSIAARPEVQGNPLYGPAFGWVAALVDAECGVFGVVPEILALQGDTTDKEEMRCGSVDLPLPDPSVAEGAEAHRWPRRGRLPVVQ